MEGKYHAMDVARYIVGKCIEDEKPISNLQLQKILYLCQVEYIRTHDEPLIVEDFEAWQYGPVIPGVYRAYSLWGGLRIRSQDAPKPLISKSDRDVIDRVVVENRERYPWDLVAETHAPGKPWDKTFLGGRGNGNVIEKKLMRS